MPKGWQCRTDNRQAPPATCLGRCRRDSVASRTTKCYWNVGSPLHHPACSSEVGQGLLPPHHPEQTQTTHKWQEHCCRVRVGLHQVRNWRQWLEFMAASESKNTSFVLPGVKSTKTINYIGRWGYSKDGRRSQYGMCISISLLKPGFSFHWECALGMRGWCRCSLPLLFGAFFSFSDKSIRDSSLHGSAVTTVCALSMIGSGASAGACSESQILVFVLPEHYEERIVS